ncbi:podocalyxin [Arvicanthis niloticus]|uniref:podocalyxin n=1 Tax=Arvicanthis niloticus TaxID=61156 RepID=UPI001485C683|nr:podocalyxin [Arvicanthis niloticus]
MRSTLALSALLLQLVLLLSPPSLSQSAGSGASTSIINSTIVRSHQNLSTAVTKTASENVTAGHLVATTLFQVQQSSSTLSKTSVQSPTTVPTTTNSRDNQSGGSVTTTSSGSEDDKTKTSSPSNNASTSSSGQTVSSGGKSTDNITKAPPTTWLTNNISSQPTDLTTSPKFPSTPTTDSITSPYQLVASSSQSTESHPEGQQTPTAVPGSSVSVSSTDNSTLTEKPTTIHKPLGTSETIQPTPSQMAGNTTFSVSTPLQPTRFPVGTNVVPRTEEFTHPSSNSTTMAPQGPSIPSPTWTSGNYKLKCDPPIMPDEELLILNLTRARLCEGSPPDERLVELLCHSVKDSFKQAQDSCTLQLAPILENQAVAVKRITIETKLSPKAVFELLKDKWDDLTEAGVSDMKLGKEGPPEVNEDRFSLPLIITIVCMASFLLLVAALYGCCHQRISQRKDQQRLTEELQTVENGYHDNPTLEVMETPSEMQEKKVVNLNGELGDSWIVPLDNLTKDDLDEEEDTHL